MKRTAIRNQSSGNVCPAVRSGPEVIIAFGFIEAALKQKVH